VTEVFVPGQVTGHGTHEVNGVGVARG